MPLWPPLAQKWASLLAMSNLASADSRVWCRPFAKKQRRSSDRDGRIRMDHLPGAAGVVGGVTTAAAETMPGLVE